MRKIIYALLALLLVVVLALLSFFFLLRKSESLIVQDNPPTIRQTTHGPVEGIAAISVLGQKYYAFRGIPYAAPPITGIDPYSGEKVDRRFKAPEPLKHNWTETLKLTVVPKLCQVTEILPEIYHKFNFSEDCLSLNIFVPAGGADKKTVLVYIHGAGIDGGTTSDLLLGPDFLLTQDIVAVHVEYRVQMFGFMNLGFGEYTGNMGLKDQQLGLKWIHDNIEYFSGKKDEIMLYGGSLGGTFVHAHTLNEESRKYFTRAFTSSGTISFWNLPIVNHVQRLHKCLEINETGNSLAEYLKAVNTSVLTKCNKKDWLLSIESPNATKAFLTKRPIDIYTSDKPPIMDTMFAMASQESIQSHPELLNITIPLIVTEQIILPFEGFDKSFNATPYPKEFEQAVEILRKVYSPKTTTIDEIRRSNIAYSSDAVITENMLRMVMLQANANNKNTTDKSHHKNTFFLRYSTHSDLNLMATKGKQNYTGAAHSDDLCYYFYCKFSGYNNVYEKHLKSKDKAYDLIMQWVKIITNFARYGDPSIEGDTPFKSCKSSNEIYCQEISNHPKSSVIADIKKQLHFDTWREVENIHKSWTARTARLN